MSTCAYCLYVSFPYLGGGAVFSHFGFGFFFGGEGYLEEIAST